MQTESKMKSSLKEVQTSESTKETKEGDDEVQAKDDRKQKSNVGIQLVYRDGYRGGRGRRGSDKWTGGSSGTKHLRLLKRFPKFQMKLISLLFRKSLFSLRVINTK